MSSPNRLDIKEDIDFEVEHFQFNKYDLEDGTILRVCEIPIKIFKTNTIDSDGIHDYLFLSNSIVSALVPVALRGEPSKESFNVDKDKRRNINFRAISEPWVSYNLADGVILKARLVVNQAYVYEKRNNFGEPIYWIQKRIILNKSTINVEFDEN